MRYRRPWFIFNPGHLLMDCSDYGLYRIYFTRIGLEMLTFFSFVCLRFANPLDGVSPCRLHEIYI